MKVVVLISAIAEWNAVKALYPHLDIRQSPYGESTRILLGNWELAVFHTGWGKIASAGMIQYVIDRYQPDLIVNLGTCGGFEGLVEQGDIVLVEKTFVYDIVELMGDLDIKSYYASSLDLSWLQDPTPYPVRRGLMASADSDVPPERIASLKEHGAIAGDWESAALAWVANRNDARLLILRGVSDIVNESTGEVYDNFQLFEERTREIMRKLFEQLPDWLNRVKL